MKLTYKHRLFLYFLAIATVFSVGVIIIEQFEERKHKTKTLEEKLATLADVAVATIAQRGNSAETLDSLLVTFPKEVRLTMLNAQGNVTYDNTIADLSSVENHATRPEVALAKKKGEGMNIRASATHKVKYLYYAKRGGDGYMRVALPYDSIQVQQFLKADNLFLYYTLAAFLVMMLLINLVAGRFGGSIRQLRDFTMATESGAPTTLSMDFPQDELGEIVVKITENYEQLSKSKKEVAAEQEKTRQLKQEMTGNIAHELRTPITGIRGYLETILSQQLDAEKQRYFISKAHRQVLTLSELVQDMGLITKIEESPLSFHMEPVGINQLLQELKADLEAPLHEKNMKIQWDIHDDVVVNGSRNLLYSIFRNLTDNAIRYAGSNTTIYISKYNEDKNFYSFSFSDNGAGIPDERHLNRLFERFYRINEGRTRDSGGSGLGLSIVKNAVLFHKGSIVAKNVTSGGLEFLFKLPKAKAEL